MRVLVQSSVQPTIALRRRFVGMLAPLRVAQCDTTTPNVVRQRSTIPFHNVSHKSKFTLNQMLIESENFEHIESNAFEKIFLQFAGFCCADERFSSLGSFDFPDTHQRKASDAHHRTALFQRIVFWSFIALFPTTALCQYLFTTWDVEHWTRWYL